jgi:hypothetical protein
MNGQCITKNLETKAHRLVMNAVFEKESVQMHPVVPRFSHALERGRKEHGHIQATEAPVGGFS